MKFWEAKKAKSEKVKKFFALFFAEQINQRASDAGKFVFAVDVFFDDVKHKIIKSAKSPDCRNQKQKPDEREISGEKKNGRQKSDD